MGMVRTQARRRTVRRSEPPFVVRVITVEDAALQKARRWVAEGKALRAVDLLLDLHEREPERCDVLRALADAAESAEQPGAAAWARGMLLRRFPHEPEATFRMAVAHAANQRPALACRMLRRFLDRWPTDALAAQARRLADELGPTVEERARAGGVSAEDRALLEEAGDAVERGLRDEALECLREVLTRHPDHVPALVELCRLALGNGDMDEAVAAARRVLTREPDHVPALSDLVRALVLSGRDEEAERAAAVLRGRPGSSPETWARKAAAFAFLGDDAAVLQAFNGARREVAGLHSSASGLLHHLAGVAALNQGQRLRGWVLLHWAEQLAPRLGLAAEVRRDHDRPAHERTGPWAFPLHEWLPRAAVLDLQRLCGRSDVERSEDARQRALEGFMRRHPAARALLPRLLHQGDPGGVKISLLLVEATDPRTMRDCLLRFAQGRHGSDADRADALQTLARWQCLPRGPLRAWVAGKLVMVQGVWPRLHESETRHGRLVERLLEDAGRALKESRLEDVEKILRKALAAEPHAPDLRLRLASCRSQLGLHGEAMDAVRDLVREHPDFVPAVALLSVQALAEERGGEARSLLEGLHDRPRMDYDSFGLLCSAHVELALAEGRPEEARSWCHTLRMARPDAPDLVEMEARIHAHRLRRWLGWPGRLLRRVTAGR